MAYSHRLSSTDLSTARAERNVSRLSAQMQDLENRVDSLSLICQAMCLECHRPLSKRHHRCMYCDLGHPLDSAFDSI